MSGLARRIAERVAEHFDVIFRTEELAPNVYAYNNSVVDELTKNIEPLLTDWHDRPTKPGLWLCVTDDGCHFAIRIDTENIENFRLDTVKKAYGPIQEEGSKNANAP